jgi:hypothetical protein
MLLAEDSDSRETGNRETGRPDFGLPVSRETKTDDHDHDDDHDDKIIMIYERETGRRFRADERSLLAEFRTVESSLIEAAIRYAVTYSREPVGSFAYCAKVIRQRAARPRQPSDTLRTEDDRVGLALEGSTNPPGSGVQLGDDDKLRFDIRTAAARLREVHRDDPTYSHDRLVIDVRAGFVVQARDVTEEQIEDALRGLAL